MRTLLSIGLVVLLFAGCDQANKSTTTTTTQGKNGTATTTTKTTTEESRTTVSKPAVTGGETGNPVTNDASTNTDSSATSNNAPSSNSNNNNQPPRADNTKVNERDRNADEVLPTDQGNNQADLDRTAEIRKRIVDLKNVSISGRNVKVITRDKKVTLRGPVASDDERQLIEKIAKDVAGSDNVNSGLEVAP